MKSALTGIMLLFIQVNMVSGQIESRGDFYVQLADEFRNHALPDSAIYYFKKASAEFKTIGNIEKLINSYNQTGILLARQDKYEEAGMYLWMALNEGQSLPDTNHLLKATTLISLGVVYNAEGDYKGALVFHHRALTIRLLKLGENHPDVATCYGNIGNVYLNKKDLDSSVEAHLKAKDIREKFFGENSIEVIQSYSNLGRVYREKKEYETSLFYFEKAMHNKIAQVGPEHKDLVKIYDSISGIYYLMGDNAQGDWYKAKSEEITKKAK